MIPEAIELDPCLVITRDTLWQWLSEAAEHAAASQHGSETFMALDQVVLASWRERHLETGCMASLWSELHARGLAPLALRCLIQIAIDSDIENSAHWHLRLRKENAPPAGQGKEGTSTEPHAPSGG